MIFYGPPGTGKTTLAYLLAKESRAVFRQLSAVSDGVKTLRETLEQAKDRLLVTGGRTLLFIDEIHRFNKAQQDVLLPEVEQGVIILVGASTENPFFTINNALLSRSRVFQFEPLNDEDIKTLIRRAATDTDRGLGIYEIERRRTRSTRLSPSATGTQGRRFLPLRLRFFLRLTRKLASIIERTTSRRLRKSRVDERACRRIGAASDRSYDRDGDGHYDSISALIKSIRGAIRTRRFIGSPGCSKGRRRAFLGASARDSASEGRQRRP